MSSIYFEKGKAREVIAPSRKRCYRCLWRGSKCDEFQCRYALEHEDTVLGTMKRLGLAKGAPCPCFAADKQVNVRRGMEKAIKEDVKKAEAAMTAGQMEKERRRLEAEKRRKEQHEARMALYNAGCDDRTIAKELGFSRDTITSWRQKNNLPANYTKYGKPAQRK